MTTKEKSKKQLENFFDLPVTVEKKEEKPQEIVASPIYDDKDEDIDEMYADIQSRAIAAHEILIDEADDVEGKYKARMYEVANAILNTGLAAIERRAKLKEHKDKQTTKTSKNVTANITNQSITINTSELIKKLSSENVIDGEALVIEQDKNK